MQLLPQDLKTEEIINDIGDNTQHIFETKHINAINAALAINRPLLVWGEPGIGKSQLAKAVAKHLKRVFIPFVADAHTESHDLLWTFDAVARLAEAQIQSAAKHNRAALEVGNFIVPGPLWWAFNWTNAEKLINSADNKNTCQRQAPKIMDGCSPANGAVVLIDEIDKADTDVPNGLLEALGESRFHPQGLPHAVECKGNKPLIIITSNEERALPDAFIRRCLALHLNFPKPEEQLTFLVTRAAINFPELHKEKSAELDGKTIIEAAAEMLIKDRAYAEEQRYYPLPGQAEYFDLLRGVKKLSEQTDISPVDLIAQLRPYTYQKNTGFHTKGD